MTGTVHSEFETHVLELNPAALQAAFSVQLDNERSTRHDLFFRFSLLDVRTGTAYLEADKEKRVPTHVAERFVSFAGFNPHEYVGHFPGLKRKGIGTLASVEILLHCIDSGRINRDYFVHNGQTLTSEGMGFLDRIGIDRYGERLETYYGKLIAYAGAKGFDFRNPLR